MATYEHDIKDTSILDKLYQKKASIATQEDTLFLYGIQNCFEELNLAGKSASLYVNSRFEARKTQMERAIKRPHILRQSLASYIKNCKDLEHT